MKHFLRHNQFRVSISYLLIAVMSFAFLPSMKVNLVHADHGDFEMAEGIYRIPYADDVEMSVGRDHHTHSPVDRYDLNAGVGTPIAAAASGWIRAIVDFNGNSPGAGDGVDINGDPQDDTLEHSCGNNPPENTVVGSCTDYNNYVWIEHPNGEWTKYTHVGTGSVTSLGWTADLDTHNINAPNWINAGEVLGVEGDIGQATSSSGGPAYHLHWEVAEPLNSNEDLEWSTRGGFMSNGQNIIPTICDIGGNSLFDAGEDYTAAPCENDAPTAEAGGPYVVNEGSEVQLNSLGSSDPENNPLTYAWSPSGNFDDPSLAQALYYGIDDGIHPIQLNVFDQIEQIPASDWSTVTVNNLPPTVNGFDAYIYEGQSASVSALISDPGIVDTHTAVIDWDDGTQTVGISRAELAAGVNHVYGDNAIYNVTITVTDDDGGVGVDVVEARVGNTAPAATINTDGAIVFPGGSYFVVEAGLEIPVSADGSDPGSDDLTFSWTVPDANTYFNNGASADPVKSPSGVFPFNASDSIDALYNAPGLEVLGLVLSDDDGGSDVAGVGVIVTGTADSTEGSGWWKHQYSGNGSTQIDTATAEGYLEIVNAVSSVFSETYPVNTLADVHTVLSPTGSDRRLYARAQLMAAWLQFASGAVDFDATIQLNGGNVAFLDLMANAEAVINNPASTDAQLHAVELDLAKLHPTN